MSLRAQVIVCAAGLALLLTRASASADDIVTDRPGFGESASVVEARHLQIETGATWTRVTSEASLLDAPQALVRIGLGRSLELQLEAPDWLRAASAAERVSGWSDTSIGLKWHAALGTSDVSVRGSLVLPTGGLGFSDERADPEIAVAWSRALSGPWSLGTTVSARRFRAYDKDLAWPSVALGRTLGSRVSTFVEYGVALAWGDRPLHQVDHGYSWLPRPDTQLDVSVGLGLSPAAPDFFVGFGVSRRF